ncbi:MAG: alkaline phosphatase family protein [Bacteroidota bacterium]
MKVLMLFLDGWGIGVKNPAVNPLFAASVPALRSLFDGELPSLGRRALRSSRASEIALDATLGVAGFPQSGTGQTALFTGVNGAKLVGRHFGPHPYSTLKPIIRERNIFRRVLATKKGPCFANAFPQRFFDYLERHQSRLTVTTLSCVYAGVPLLRASDLATGRGISADITGEGWHGLGYPDMPTVTPAEAGRRLTALASAFDFVLFEYWRTDHAGHAMSMKEAVEVLETFDGLLGGIIDTLDPATTLLLITSDHGNIEDLSVKTHTRHPVPLIAYGRDQRDLVERLMSEARGRPDLTTVTPAVMEYLSLPLAQTEALTA